MSNQLEKIKELIERLSLIHISFAYLEQHAQILIVEKADAFRDSGLFPLSLHRQQQFVLTLSLIHIYFILNGNFFFRSCLPD